MAQEFFVQRPSINPTIYVYKLTGVQSHKGFVKVGYTERDVDTRIKEQIGASHVPYHRYPFCQDMAAGSQKRKGGKTRGYTGYTRQTDESFQHRRVPQ